ncbi:helix-turn-helix domain-containing protein [Candidatus Pacearchaeota archaeon]|nr:helix-turn-helix domain-containing protein [Candidatus Pacearchaeota archaeon]
MQITRKDKAGGTMVIKEASAFLGKTRKTIKEWCESGKLRAKKISARNLHGFMWEIEKKSVMEIAGTLAEKISEKNKKIEKKFSKNESTPAEVPEREKADRKITRQEAERLIKVEDAIRKQQENLLRENRLLDVETLEYALEVHYSGLMEMWEELIDVWVINGQVKPGRAKEMLDDFQGALKTSWKRMRGKIFKNENRKSSDNIRAGTLGNTLGRDAGNKNAPSPS